METESSTTETVAIDSSNASDPLASCYTTDTISSLSNGLIDFYKPSLININQQLHELTEKQNVLVEQLHDENLKLSWSKNSPELTDLFTMLKIYQTKLLNIKRDMRYLHDKSAKLRKRALRLQQHKEKQIYTKTKQVQQEQDLIAKRNEK